MYMQVYGLILMCFVSINKLLLFCKEFRSVAKKLILINEIVSLCLHAFKMYPVQLKIKVKE